METATLHTLGQLALRLRAQPHHLLRLVKLGKVPFVRVGRYHAFSEAAVPEIYAALVAAGYAKGGLPEVLAHA